MSRRLLTYLCIDTSGSMNGEPIVAVNAGLQALLTSLRSNPYALDSVHLAITTFDSEIKEVLPMTAVADVTLPEITCPKSGATLLGAALEHIFEQVQRDVRKTTSAEKGDWKPILVILTDGKPTDTLAFSEVIPRLQSCGFAKIVACAAGPKADPAQLKRLTEHVVSLDTMDASSFSKFFEWVSATFSKDSQSRGATASVDLPPPPPEVNIVV
ncbi:MAG: VWA domain-containing protein [Rhodocyclaceae bacterium]|nr:VWA domain-containing protein [Rhodocyclaceae bacterium]